MQRKIMQDDGIIIKQGVHRELCGITLVLIISLSLLLCSCSQGINQGEPPSARKHSEIRAVWIYYGELSMINENGGTESSFTAKISKMFDNCKEMNINTVFVQVRPFADSFYRSAFFPWSKYLTGEQGRSVDYDPLKIMVEQAHARSISIHAWINPFRISLSSSVCDSHPAKEWIDKKTNDVIITESGAYFNPASPRAVKLILDGVREIALKYDVDGIHIDDYFYMSDIKDEDINDYRKYTSSGGELTLSEWRRQNISSFVSSMYSAVKSADSSLIVSVSPAGNIDNNLYSLYANVRKWGSKSGYCDWLIPQLYYPFESKKLPFKKAADDWKKLVSEKSVKLIAGIGAYNAADEPEGEWLSDDIILRQISYTQNAGYQGWCLFSYSSIMSEAFAANKKSMQVLFDDGDQPGGGD